MVEITEHFNVPEPDRNRIITGNDSNSIDILLAHAHTLKHVRKQFSKILIRIRCNSVHVRPLYFGVFR